MTRESERVEILELHAMKRTVPEIGVATGLPEETVVRVIRKAEEMPTNFYEALLVACVRVTPDRTRKRRTRLARLAGVEVREIRPDNGESK